MPSITKTFSRTNPLIIKITLLLAIVITSLFFIKTALAQTNIFQQKQEAIQGQNLTPWTLESLTDTIYGVTNIIAGTIPPSPATSSLQNPSSISHYLPGGAIGGTSNLIGQLYQPPASGIEYLASLKNDFLGIKPAYAQGVGFVGLQGLIPIWKIFRNIVYLLSSVILILIGVMIMLRIKISPQAVVSIQSALPQLLLTLVLVTFSYAIVGLLIDFSYFIQGAIIALLFQSKGVAFSQNLYDSRLWSAIDPAQWANSYRYSELMRSDLGTMFNLISRAAPIQAVAVLGGIVGGIIGGLMAAPILGFAAGALLVTAIFLILILFWIIKLYFGLLKCYVTLIFKIIIGPLEIAMGAFPSAKMGFGSWITDVIANLSVFPITILFMIIANLIIERTATGLWFPNLLQGSLIGAGVNVASLPGGGVVPIALGLATIMLASQLPALIPQAVFMLKPTAWETAIGKGASEPVSLVGQGFGVVNAYNKLRKNYYEAEATRRRLPQIQNQAAPTPVAPKQAPPAHGPVNPPTP